ncbi:hypothetical protein ACHAXT_002433 [Thalassiosira profunda]
MIADVCNSSSPFAPFEPEHISSSGKITPEQPAPIEPDFSNYDVLLLPSGDDDAVRFAPGQRVGNQRFRVLLSLSRPRFIQASERGDEDECKRIADDVFDTVCRRCSPNGRFYEEGGNGQWQELQGAAALPAIRSALRNEPRDMERARKRVLRRSSTFGSLVSMDSEDDDVTLPGPFDVVCAAGGLRLNQDAQITGNNRLKVLVSLRMINYKKANASGRRNIAQEIVNSIMDGACSQFLHAIKASGAYKPMARESAVACVTRVFAAAAEGGKRHIRSSELKKLRDRKRKKQVLGKLERRNKLPSAASPPTTFRAFEPADVPGLQVAI